MKKVIIGFIILTLFVICSAFVLAGDIKDQFQESYDGVSYDFYSYSPYHKWAKQSFVPQYEKIIKVDLKIDTVDQCGGLNKQYELFDVRIKDNTGHTVAKSVDNNACYLYDWESFTLTQTEDLVAGQKYWVYVFYRGNGWSYKSTMNWGRATSDSAYSIGEAVAPDGLSEDFAFRTWGYTPEPTCKVEKKCKGNQVVQVYADCSQDVLQTCSGDYTCDSASCVYKYPNVNIEIFNLKDENNNDKYSFLQGENVVFYASTKNYGKAGQYTTKFKILKDGQMITDSGSINHNIDVAYATDVVSWTYTLPLNMNGQYTARAEIIDCLPDKTCSVEKTFTVNQPCTDSDGDGYGTGCASGSDCDDSNNAIHQEISCSYDGNTCGSYSLCAASCPLPPSEILCDGKDNDCNPSTLDDPCTASQVCDSQLHQCVNTCTDQEGWVCEDDKTVAYLNTDCSYTQQTTCGENEKCIAAECTPDTSTFSDEAMVLLDRELFFDISDDLIARGEVNKVFFTNESEEVAELTLENIRDGLGKVNDIIQIPLMGMDEYKWVIETTTTIDIAETSVLMIEETGDDVLFFYYESTQIDVTEVTVAMKETDEFVKGLNFANDLLTGGLTVWYAYNQVGGDITNSDFAVYLTLHHAYYNLLPQMAVLSFVKAGKDITFGIIGIDPAKITCDLGAIECGFWLVNGVIDVLTDEEIFTNSLNGQCGLLTGQTAVCMGELWDAFTHPLAFVTDVDYSYDNGITTFNIEMDNYWKYFDGELYLGATLYEGDTPVCNLPWKKVYFGPGEMGKVVTLQSTVPKKDKQYKLVTKLWYECKDGCEDPVCYTDGCCMNEKMHSTFSMDFEIENTPPIINSITCNALGYMGTQCQESLELYAGDQLKITVTAHDLDGDNLEMTTAGEIGTTKECEEINGGKICTFTYQSTQADSGKEYWFNLIVNDGYYSNKNTYTLSIQGNPPIILRPKQSDENNGITMTQTPTFEWQNIHSGFPINYDIYLYKDDENNHIMTLKGIPQKPSTWKTAYALEESNKLDKDKYYWWEVVATNEYNQQLTSTKEMFFVDCWEDSQCGQSLTIIKICGEKGVYEQIQYPKCINPGTLNSYCGFYDVEEVLVEECVDGFGCEDSICVPKQGCDYNNPFCGEDYNCVENECVLKEGCYYNNPGCDNDYYCDNNICILKYGCNYNNPGCGEDYDCISNECILKEGCYYNNPGCDDDHYCDSNVCILKPGCLFNNPGCGQGYGCVENECIKETIYGSFNVRTTATNCNGKLWIKDVTLKVFDDEEKVDEGSIDNFMVYELFTLPVGTYTVEASKEGFITKAVRYNVKESNNKPLTITLKQLTECIPHNPPSKKAVTKAEWIKENTEIDKEGNRNTDRGTAADSRALAGTDKEGNRNTDRGIAADSRASAGTDKEGDRNTDRGIAADSRVSAGTDAEPERETTETSTKTRAAKEEKTAVERTTYTQTRIEINAEDIRIEKE